MGHGVIAIEVVVEAAADRANVRNVEHPGGVRLPTSGRAAAAPRRAHPGAPSAIRRVVWRDRIRPSRNERARRGGRWARTRWAKRRAHRRANGVGRRGLGMHRGRAEIVRRVVSYLERVAARGGGLGARHEPHRCRIQATTLSGSTGGASPGPVRTPDGSSFSIGAHPVGFGGEKRRSTNRLRSGRGELRSPRPQPCHDGTDVRWAAPRSSSPPRKRSELESAPRVRWGGEDVGCDAGARSRDPPGSSVRIVFSAPVLGRGAVEWDRLLDPS